MGLWFRKDVSIGSKQHEIAAYGSKAVSGHDNGSSDIQPFHSGAHAGLELYHSLRR
jgi:hypothetical protein